MEVLTRDHTLVAAGPVSMALSNPGQVGEVRPCSRCCVMGHPGGELDISEHLVADGLELFRSLPHVDMGHSGSS